MFRILSLLFVILGVSFQASAQCGVYFKESSRQMLSNSFVNGVFEDFDNDGLDDLFGYSVTEYSNQTPLNYQIHYYKRLSANSFDTTARSTSITNVGTFYGIFGDVNADGKKDLIVTQRTNPLSLVTYLNDGTGRFVTTTPAVNLSANEYVVAAGDLNNDGKADVLSNSITPSNNLFYRLAQPDNSFGAPVLITNFPGFLLFAEYLDYFSSSIVIEDLDNDGTKDIAFVNNQNGYKLHVFRNIGGLTFTETFSTDFPPPITRLRTFDINNDGKKDFVSNERLSQITLAVNIGNNLFAPSTITLPPNTYYSSYIRDSYVADFDNDGDQDLLYPGTRRYLLLRNQGSMTFVPQEYKSLLSIDVVGNLDGDGKADAVSLIRPFVDGGFHVVNGSNTESNYLFNAVTFRTNVCGPVGQTKMVDFNADGFSDRAFWNPTTGVWRSYTENRINSNTQITFQWGSGSLGDVPAPNDFDGDGQTDYAVFRRPNGTWWIYRSSDQQPYGQSFGIIEDKPVPADYDGDGKADIAVFRPSTGDWHFWLSQTSQYKAVHFGVSEDKPVPADYDGDGKADIAIFRPSTGHWYRLNSSDNSLFVMHYGIGTDKPIPADYDGDGKANIAVYRDGVWYVLRDNLSTSYIYFGSANDEPFFDNAVEPFVYAYRRTNSTIYATRATLGMPFNYLTGSSPSEVLVSSILPPE